MVRCIVRGRRLKREWATSLHHDCTFRHKSEVRTKSLQWPVRMPCKQWTRCRPRCHNQLPPIPPLIYIALSECLPCSDDAETPVNIGIKNLIISKLFIYIFCQLPRTPNLFNATRVISAEKSEETAIFEREIATESQHSTKKLSKLDYYSAEIYMFQLIKQLISCPTIKFHCFAIFYHCLKCVVFLRF